MSVGRLKIEGVFKGCCRLVNHIYSWHWKSLPGSIYCSEQPPNLCGPVIYCSGHFKLQEQKKHTSHILLHHLIYGTVGVDLYYLSDFAASVYVIELVCIIFHDTDLNWDQL